MPSSPQLPGGESPDARPTTSQRGTRRVDVAARQLAERVGMPGLATHTVIAALLLLLVATGAGLTLRSAIRSRT